MMNRRRFLGTLVAVAVAPMLPTLAAPPVVFHPDAFTLTMESLSPIRLDVLYGFGTFRQGTACVVSA